MYLLKKKEESFKESDEEFKAWAFGFISGICMTATIWWLIENIGGM